MTARADPSLRPGLRLFLDSAERAAWERWLGTGLFFGVTTNPTILDAAGLRCTLPVIRSMIPGEIARLEDMKASIDRRPIEVARKRAADLAPDTPTGDLAQQNLALLQAGPQQ